jgi:hypothetical protein
MFFREGSENCARGRARSPNKISARITQAHFGILRFRVGISHVIKATSVKATLSVIKKFVQN